MTDWNGVYKGAAMIYFNILSRHLSAETKKMNSPDSRVLNAEPPGVQ